MWEAAPGGLLKDPARRLWTVAQSLLLILLTCAVLYLPLWSGLATFRPITSGPFTEQYINSLAYLAKIKLPVGASDLATALGWQPTDMWTAGAISYRLSWPTRWGPMLIFAVFAVIATWRARTFPRMLVAWGWVTFAYLTVGAVWFWPWYVIWLVPIAALLGPGRLFNATQILCFTSMALYATTYRGHETYMEWGVFAPLVLIGLPLLYAIGSWLIENRRMAGDSASRTETRPPIRRRLANICGQLAPARVRIDSSEGQ
jgi:hypothetical protein